MLHLTHGSLSAGEISPSPQCALVLEDEIGVCGYALALIDAKPAAVKAQVMKDVIAFLNTRRLSNSITSLSFISYL